MRGDAGPGQHHHVHAEDVQVSGQVGGLEAAGDGGHHVLDARRRLHHDVLEAEQLLAGAAHHVAAHGADAEVVAAEETDELGHHVGIHALAGSAAEGFLAAAVGVDGHGELRVARQGLQGPEAGGEEVDHEGVGAVLQGDAGVVLEPVRVGGNVGGVEHLEAGLVLGPGQRLRHLAHPLAQGAIGHVEHLLVVLDEAHPAQGRLVADVGHLVGSEAGSGLDDCAHDQLARLHAQDLAGALDAEARAGKVVQGGLGHLEVQQARLFVGGEGVRAAADHG